MAEERGRVEAANVSGNEILLVAAAIIGYAVVSGRLETTPLTAPMAFVAAGIVFQAFGAFEFGIEDPFVAGVMEATLVVALFTDASRIDLARLRTEFAWPARLLTVGMLLSIAFGTLAALWLFPELSVAEAAVLGVILAPTDAALGKATVSHPRVPVWIRQTLNVESGLNDGLALPLLFVALAFGGAGTAETGLAYWLRFGVESIGVALIVGAAVGYLGARMLVWGLRSGWINIVFTKLAGLTLALVAFVGTERLGGSGFIAAFVAGAVLGNLAREACGPVYEFAEVEGQLLALLTFLFFGAIAVVPTLEALTWQIVLYGVLSLTVLRMVPVAIALFGSGLRRISVWFIAWFGPRGLATVVFSLVVLEDAGMEALDTIFEIAAFVVILSIVAHGLTAVPVANRYADTLERLTDREEMLEMQPAPELPTQFGVLPTTEGEPPSDS